MDHDIILTGLQQSVKELYRNSPYGNFYHDKQRRKSLINLVAEFAETNELGSEDRFVLACAAWIYGTGFLSAMQDAATLSLMQADALLGDKGLKSSQLAEIRNVLSAAFTLSAPATRNERIFTDCVYAYFADEDFKETVSLLYKEEKQRFTMIQKAQFYQDLIQKMDAHSYYTELAQARYNERKTINRRGLGGLVPAVDEHRGTNRAHQKKDPVLDAKPSDLKVNKGIDTMFKIISTNSQRLSDMADNKAHIMITVNSIILSAVISLLLRRLTDYHYLVAPTMIILAVSLTAITFAILATRPSVPKGTYQREDIENKTTNLLFFGNFYKMPIEDYKYGIGKMMEDTEFLYNSLTRDVYMQGKVLGKKYRFLRISYNVFMYGLFVSVTAFALAAWLFNAQA